jgi:hypothetical protein
MKFNQTSEKLTLTDGRLTQAVGEDQLLFPDERKARWRKLLLSLNSKLEKLAQMNNRLFQTTIHFDEKKQSSDDPNLNLLSQEGSLSESDALTEPVLVYQLSWLLDFLKDLYGFEEWGMFLLDDGGDSRGDLERLFASSGASEEFVGEIEAAWVRGEIDPAVTQKRITVLTAKRKGSFLIIPFTILDGKVGFWAAYFKQNTLPQRKTCLDLLFWVELFSSMIENSYGKGFALMPQQENFPPLEELQFFHTIQLYKALTHEINNPLQVILGRIQLLRINERRSTKDTSNLSILETLEGNVNRVCSILKDFSDHLHRQFDKTTDTGEVNIHHILKGNLLLLEYLLKSNGISLQQHMDDTLPSVYGNPGQLEFAFLTLILKIKDHLSSGGSIRIRTSTAGEYLCLDLLCKGEEIRSNGCDDVSDLRRDAQFKLASQILERHNGKLRCERTGDDQMKFSLMFTMVPQRKTDREKLHELKL